MKWGKRFSFFAFFVASLWRDKLAIIWASVYFCSLLIVRATSASKAEKPIGRVITHELSINATEVKNCVKYQSNPTPIDLSFTGLVITPFMPFNSGIFLSIN